QTPEIGGPGRGQVEGSYSERAAWESISNGTAQIRANAGRTDVYTWELLRTSDSQLRLLFKHPLSRDPHVVVVTERHADQILQLRLPKHLRPLLIAQRILVCAGYRRLVCAAVNHRCRELRTHIIWSHGATGYQDEQRCRAGQCDWCCSFERGGVHARPPSTSGVTLGSPRGACVESIV